MIRTEGKKMSNIEHRISKEEVDPRSPLPRGQAYTCESRCGDDRGKQKGAGKKKETGYSMLDTGYSMLDTGYSMLDTGYSMAEGVCEDCEYSVPAGDSSSPTLICRHKAGAELPWQVVEAGGSCSNFERSRELVSLDIAAALAEGAKLIPLTQDKFAIVDAEDYEWLSKYKWCASRKKRVFYARRNERRTRRQIIMHRVILNAPPHLVVDHINHNGLDNRRKNIRLCTRAENNRNRRPNVQPNQWSKYKGVSFDKKRKLFRAFIHRNKKQYYLGSFKNETEAAKAYDKKALELFGEFAYLNFPPSS